MCVSTSRSGYFLVIYKSINMIFSKLSGRIVDRQGFADLVFDSGIISILSGIAILIGWFGK